MQDRLRIFQANFLSNNTVASYTTGVKQFVIFCAIFRNHLPVYPYFPVSDTVLANFVVWESQFVEPNSVKQYIHGVAAWQQWNNYPFAKLKERLPVFQAFQGLKRYFGAPSQSVMEVTADMLARIYPLVDRTNPDDITLWAAFLMAYYCTLRKDNISVGKADAFNPRANLCNGDLVLDSSGSKGTVTIKHAKCNQFFERSHTIPLIGYGGKLCVIAALSDMLIRVPCSREASKPLFQLASGKSFVPMTHSNFVRGFKRLAAKAGYNPNNYAGHSFRRGSATAAFRADVPKELIKWQGDWASDAWERYVELTENQKAQLPKALVAGAALAEGFAF